MNKKLLTILVAAALMAPPAKAYFSYYPRTNFSLPTDPNLWNCGCMSGHGYEDGDPERFKLTVGATLEYGYDEEGRDENNNVVKPFHIFAESENLNLFDIANPPGALAGLIVQRTNLNLIAGFQVESLTEGSSLALQTDAKRDQTDLNLWTKINLPIESIPGETSVSAYLPIKYSDVKDAQWAIAQVTDSGTNNVPAGSLGLLNSDELVSIFQEGTGQDIRNHNKTCRGDFHLVGTWKNSYNQVHESLSEVSLMLQYGISIPTSKNVGEEKAPLAFPFGNENSLGIPVCAAIDMKFMENIRLGAAVDALWSFSETSNRTMRSYETEGEVLLVNSYSVRRDPGTLYRLSAFGDVLSSCQRFKFGFGYQYFYRSEDKFSSNDTGFRKDLADAAQKAQDMNYHHVLFRGEIDFTKLSDSELAPVLSFQYKHPLRGKRVVLYNTFTFGAHMSF